MPQNIHNKKHKNKQKLQLRRERRTISRMLVTRIMPITLTIWWNAWARILKSRRRGSLCRLPQLNHNKTSRRSSISKSKELSKDMKRKIRIRKSQRGSSVGEEGHVKSLIFQLKMKPWNKRLILRIPPRISKARKCRVTECTNRQAQQRAELQLMWRT